MKCDQNCNQGRSCSCKLNTLNGDASDPQKDDFDGILSAAMVWTGACGAVFAGAFLAHIVIAYFL